MCNNENEVEYPKELYDLPEKDFIKCFQQQLTLRRNGLISISDHSFSSYCDVFLKRFVEPRSDYQQLVSEFQKGNYKDMEEYAKKHSEILDDEFAKHDLLI